MRSREIAEARACYGYYRIDILLRLEGWKVKNKRVDQVCQKEWPRMRRNRPRGHAHGPQRVGRIKAGTAKECWSIDFVSDSLGDGRWLRVLPVVDNDTRKYLAIEVDQEISGEFEA